MREINTSVCNTVVSSSISLANVHASANTNSAVIATEQLSDALLILYSPTGAHHILAAAKQEQARKKCVCLSSSVSREIAAGLPALHEIDYIQSVR